MAKLTRTQTALLLALSSFVVDGDTVGAHYKLVQVAEFPPSTHILYSHERIDLDDDGRSEIILKRAGVAEFAFFEWNPETSSWPNVNEIDLSGDPNTAVVPYSTSDADQDGLSEVLVHGRTQGVYYTRVYESLGPGTFPSNLVWDFNDAPGWEVGLFSGDMDHDGVNEIITAGQGEGGDERILVFESNGTDNGFVEVDQLVFAEMHTSHFMTPSHDLDADGWEEILFAGLVGTTSMVYVVESIENDRYAIRWAGELVHNGTLVNAQELLAADDLDGDGFGEIVVGGLRAVSQIGESWQFVLQLFEAAGDDDYVLRQSFAYPLDLKDHSGLNVADLDGDGRREIILAVGPLVRILERSGEDTWELADTIDTGDDTYTIGAGDYDLDGLEEIVLQSAMPPPSMTRMYEIHPALAADADADGRVDAIDNCPALANPEQADADADEVGDVCDNCPDGFNPEQGPAVLAPPLLAEDEQQFTWGFAADVVWVRGPLAGVGSYTVDFVETEIGQSGFRDLDVPEAGAGFSYLVRPACAVGSWQTTPGAEPARDAALP